MANVTGASLTPIFERLRDMPTHHPVSAETFSDWSLEAGDTVTISRDGKAYRSPVHTSTLTWKGKTPTITVNSTGNERRDAVSKVSRKKYNSGAAGMRNNQGLYNDVWSEDGHVHSVISQTSSTLTMYVNDRYNQMTSGLNMTSSSAALYVNDRYNQMTSGLKLTSSSAALYVDNKYTQMRSGLSLTSSSAALYVDNKYDQMRAGLSLTSSSAALYVDNKYAQMKAGLDITSSSACLYAKNRTTRAYIMTRINADGEGEALINADKVKISGTTTINDVMTITDQRLHVKTDARIQGDVMVESVTVRSGSDSQSISESDLATTIKKATVSNNTLTLTQYNGSTITFSKAVSLSDGWSGSVASNKTYTVTATQGGTTVGSKGVTIHENISGTAQDSTFTGEFGTYSGSNFTRQGYIQCYMVLMGSGSSAYVDVNSKSDGTGTTYARLSVGSLYTEGYNYNLPNGISISTPPVNVGTTEPSNSTKLTEFGQSYIKSHYSGYGWLQFTVTVHGKQKKYHFAFDNR